MDVAQVAPKSHLSKKHLPLMWRHIINIRSIFWTMLLQKILIYIAANGTYYLWAAIRVGLMVHGII
jgi:hypothetical protein